MPQTQTDPLSQKTSETSAAAQAPAPLLTTDKLVKEYKQRRVVNGVSIRVNAGEIVGLLGPNGAGKTTSFNMVVGLVKPDAGSVQLAAAERHFRKWADNH